MLVNMGSHFRRPLQDVRAHVYLSSCDATYRACNGARDIPLARRGSAMTGFNRSDEMLANARSKTEEVREEHAMRYPCPQEVRGFLNVAGFQVAASSSFMQWGIPLTAQDWNLFAVAVAE
jgi:hypothetical protein